MAVKKATAGSFEVYFTIKTDIGVTINAPSFEEALVLARALKPFDIIDDDTRQINDYDAPVITGVYKSS